MISNLLIMVIIGGYEPLSRESDSHPDQPEWLSHVNASVLKVKLDRHYWHFIYSFAQNIYQCQSLHGEW
jgi:uncharacterized protein (TIGR00645 family)